MIPEENISDIKPDIKPEVRIRRRAIRLLAAMIVLSIFFGAIAGLVAGSFAVRLDRGIADIFYSKNPPAKQNSSVGIQAQNPSAFSGGIVDVVKRVSPAVVSITVSQQMPDPNDLLDGSTAEDYQEVAAGSGFFVSSNGLIITNKHVVSLSNAEYTVTTADGKTYNAKVLAQDPVNDLALVQIVINNAPTLQLSDSSTIQIGQQVIAIGNSLGEYQNTVTSGIISGIGRNVTAGSDEGDGTDEELDGVIQTDAAINPGNSGGPLLNSAGQVIGVNTAIDEGGQLVGFAIPSNLVAKDISSFDTQGKIIKPFLGLSYISINPDSQMQYNLSVSAGAYITATPGTSAIVPGSAADKAGLKSGDIITAINGQAIDQTHTLSQLLQEFNPGDTITLSILRDNKKLSIPVTLGSK